MLVDSRGEAEICIIQTGNLMFSFAVVDFGLVLSDKPVLPAVINEHKPHKIAQK